LGCNQDFYGKEEEEKEYNVSSVRNCCCNLGYKTL